MKPLLKISAVLMAIAFFLSGCTIRFKATEIELDSDIRTPGISKNIERNTTYELESISLLE